MKFYLGVTDSTPQPHGHQHGNRFQAIVWLGRMHVSSMRVSRLQEVQKGPLDVASDDYFLEDDDNGHTRSMLNESVVGREGVSDTQLRVKAVDLTTADDWTIQSPKSFAEAVLISKKKKVRLAIWKLVPEHWRTAR